VVRRWFRDFLFSGQNRWCAHRCREPDGLAMSSRNTRLKGEFGHRRWALWRAIPKAAVDPAIDTLVRQSA